MDDSYAVFEGTGWISLGNFGEINPRRDNVDGGRQHFTAKLAAGGYATAIGEGISEGPETWRFEFDEPFHLVGADGEVLEVIISPLERGEYGVQFRRGELPDTSGHAW